MATLVLSTVGTALGGPIGGALGSLLGQSIDRTLLGSGSRRGPRLGDLAIQTSSYGSPIPQVFGTIRVAGTVVWATNLQEEEAIQGGGKGSPGQTAYVYSANFAVALSSRPVRAVRRIWADGKLIRGEAGDFKVKTSFRLLTGSEDQEIDPLIGSVETLSRTPAYRGVALAIFEGLELAEFGNRIPALSFEVEADAEPTRIGQLLSECSEGLIETDDQQCVAGFAAYGSSIADAVRPLVEIFNIELAERDGQLRRPGQPAAVYISEAELGCAADGQPKHRLQLRRNPNSKLPASCTFVYYDPSRDYQAGQMRASSGGAGQRDERMELPAAVPAEQAKQLAEQALAKRLAGTDGVKIWLSPRHMNLRPGDHILLPAPARSLMVQSVTLDGFAVEIEARPAKLSVATNPADPGRSVSEPDLIIGRTEPFVVELPAMGDAPEAAPRVVVAGSNSGLWKPVPVEAVLGSEMLASLVLSRRALSGRAISALHARVPAILDDLSSVTVQLSNPDATLLNADLDALMSGANLAMLADELIQFGRAEQLGQGLFRLTKLLRGRRGTEWAAFHHGVGDPFVLIDPVRMSFIDLPSHSVGAILKCTSFGIADVASQPQVEIAVRGEALRPPAPAHVKLSLEDAKLRARWVRRTHRGWVWNDGVDAGPDAYPERYRVRLSAPRGAIEIEATTPTVVVELSAIPADVGEVVELEVAMIGPSALSHDVRIGFTV